MQRQTGADVSEKSRDWNIVSLNFNQVKILPFSEAQENLKGLSLYTSMVVRNQDKIYSLDMKNLCLLLFSSQKLTLLNINRIVWVRWF